MNIIKKINLKVCNTPEHGAAMIEYAMLISLIALSVMLAVGLLGRNTSTIFTTVGNNAFSPSSTVSSNPGNGNGPPACPPGQAKQGKC